VLRVDVAAARQQQAIHQLQVRLGVFRQRRNQQRQAAGALHRRNIFGWQRVAAALVAAVGGDADDRAFHCHSERSEESCLRR
jgi:hypothetical protein